MDLSLITRRQAANLSKAVADQPREEALRWFEELRDPLRRYLLCSGASPADADDAVQETFLRLYRHLRSADDFKPGDHSNLHGWIFRVARNYLRDERKSSRSRLSVDLKPGSDIESRSSSAYDTPETGALRDDRNRMLQAAIERLPEQQRECILLRSSGMRNKEIAAIMGIAESSVGSLVHRAVARLRKDLS
jgi:RNA polymerase sigma-70 factor (ECF subfamily)